MNHTSEVIGNKMIVFGGQGKFFTNEVLGLKKKEISTLTDFFIFSF